MISDKLKETENELELSKSEVIKLRQTSEELETAKIKMDGLEKEFGKLYKENKEMKTNKQQLEFAVEKLNERLREISKENDSLTEQLNVKKADASTQTDFA